MPLNLGAPSVRLLNSATCLGNFLIGDRENLGAMPLALLPFTKAKILNKKLVFWPDKLIKVSALGERQKAGGSADDDQAHLRENRWQNQAFGRRGDLSLL